MEFNLNSEVTDNYNVTYYATDIQGGITVQAVASVRDGKCELTGSTKRPTLIYVTTRKSIYPLVIFADRGEKIEITGEGKEPLDWIVEGNDINRQLTSWRLDHREILNDHVADSVNNAVRSYVEEYPEKTVSTILMMCYFNRKVDERGYTLLMGSLKDEAKNSDLLRTIGRSDQLYHSYSYPARLESMILKSVNKNVDTLKIDEKNPILLMFWQTGYAQRKELIDSIKKLEKEFPDSSRIIADICLDVDSASWRSAIRKDSLDDKMKRFWVPTGINNSTVMKLKVTQLPYFIVFDKEGYQSYRGGEISEAMEKYRNLFNSGDSIK